MTKIKLCGLRRVEDVAVVNRLRPDYAGVILAENPKFWRAVTAGRARALRDVLDPEIPLVGVFVDDREERILQLLEEGVINIAQLHGREDAETIVRLRRRAGRPVFKAFRVQSETDLRQAVDSPADAVLLDGGTGAGTAFDWALLGAMKRPYFLAGGLTPETVGQAVRAYHPYAVDVSSGIETNREKDANKMAAFVQAVRNADQDEECKL